MLFISPAYAEASTAAAAASPSGGDFLMSLLPIFLIILVFYFMVIRPQNRRFQEHKNMVNALQKGDKVVTAGGLIATVKKAAEGADEITLELSPGVEVHAVRSTIMTIRKKD